MRLLAIAVALLAVSCNTADSMSAAASSSSSAAAVSVPRIEITSDGGFAGRGTGGVVINGDAVTATDLSARNCTGTLTDDERRILARAAAEFKAGPSRENAHPDQFHYVLMTGGQQMAWYGEEAPPEARPLFDAAWKVRQRVLAACR